MKRISLSDSGFLRHKVVFLSFKIKFLDIEKCVEAAVNAQPCVESYILEDVFEADINARNLVRQMAN